MPASVGAGTPMTASRERRQARRFRFEASPHHRLTHYLFRFPAKFHPPIARALIEAYTQPGDVVLDPFCGSGTLLVEASMLGRHSIGIDVDPVAAYVSSVKVHRYRMAELERTIGRIRSVLAAVRREESEYEDLMVEDIGPDDLLAELANSGSEMWVPEIPRLDHWFRRYVRQRPRPDSPRNSVAAGTRDTSKTANACVRVDHSECIERGPGSCFRSGGYSPHAPSRRRWPAGRPVCLDGSGVDPRSARRRRILSWRRSERQSGRASRRRH